MIAIESIKRFKIIDVTAIVVLACLWLLLSFLVSTFFSPQIIYILSLLIATTLMSLAVHLVRKAGTAILFYSFGALLTNTIYDLGATGINKLIVLVIAGIIFELVFLILKIEVKSVQLDIIISTAISAATIPLTTALLISFNTALNMIIPIINMMLLSLLIGLIGAFVSFLLWYNLKTTKTVLKFEYQE